MVRPRAGRSVCRQRPGRSRRQVPTHGRRVADAVRLPAGERQPARRPLGRAAVGRRQRRAHLVIGDLRPHRATLDQRRPRRRSAHHRPHRARSGVREPRRGPERARHGVMRAGCAAPVRAERRAGRARSGVHCADVGLRSALYTPMDRTWPSTGRMSSRPPWRARRAGTHSSDERRRRWPSPFALTAAARGDKRRRWRRSRADGASRRPHLNCRHCRAGGRRVGGLVVDRDRCLRLRARAPGCPARPR